MGNKRTLHYSLTFLILIQSINLKAQTTPEFVPYGKPFALIFTDVSSTISNGEYSKSFDISRAYLGYEYFFTKNISSKINIDVADPGVGKLQMTAFLKNAFLQYKNDKVAVRFGMIPTIGYSLQEKIWGYRYIYKSFQDAYNFGPSADLGASVEYSPAKFISLDLSVLNGEGYKKIQSDSTFKTTFGITVRPVDGLVLRGYLDMMNHSHNQTTLALFAGYTYKAFRAGIEYNNQKNNGTIFDHDFSGVSLYSSIGVGKKISIFGRYDNLTSTTLPGETLPWNDTRDGQLFMTGFDYSPAAGIKISPNFQGWSPYEKSLPFSSTVALNFEIRF